MQLLRRHLAFLIAACLVGSTPAIAQSSVQAPMHCSRGDENQTFNAVVTLPAAQATGSLLHIRVDGKPSGLISHFGLHYLHDMVTEYTLPIGATYVEGSARLVAGTGTANVLEKATVQREGRKLRLILPAHINNDSSYTPPSIELVLRITARPGAKLLLQFSGYRLVANAVIVGDVATSCEPVPNPFVIGTTLVSRSAQAAR